ncbi:hypothetical protein [Saccharomonospora xinjiangensis]|uniref:Uncharacterized protein n=1 Tax=Saccharomonospora xinjiangensis XJ-54 TaxID=882086 RepID=I0V242_9PSEU|nr:hypothetical protein [Saccharomonospora xinjiangensis]EID54195.1 hypothetical protein SacxiDRAFT_1958 [Saccharomonospora xinjiangensis XJ-54]
MACKITHRVHDQQIRFANRDAAERYAEIMGGGVQNWIFTTVPDTDDRNPRPHVVSAVGGPGHPAGTDERLLRPDAA